MNYSYTRKNLNFVIIFSLISIILLNSLQLNNEIASDPEEQSINTPQDFVPPSPELLDRIKKGEVTLPHMFDPSWQTNSGINAVNSEQSATQLTGNIRMLAVAVDFSDKVHTVSASYFDSLLFALPKPGPGSVRDYYNEISYGQVDFVTLNLPSSFGWVRAPSPYYYYANHDYGEGAYPYNDQKLAEDVIDALNATIDFSQYDNNHDGFTEPIVIIHSGSGAETTGNPDDLWSVSWSISNSHARYYDGVTIQRFTIQPEYFDFGNNYIINTTIGVFAHEMAHGFFGVPDLYDIDYSSQGAGYFDLMSSGNWNGPHGSGDVPAWPSAWIRMQMGFITPTTVTTNIMGQNIPQVFNNPTAGTVFKLHSPALGPNEYFLVENRQKVSGSYDQYLPGSGLFIWHVDEAMNTYSLQNNYECSLVPQSSCSDSQHYLVALQQADGLFQLERTYKVSGGNYGDAGDPFPGTTNKRNWTSSTVPESSSWYGTGKTCISVNNISNSSPTMAADLNIFCTDVPPYSFSKNTPGNGATGLSLNPSLIWGTSFGATSYEYCYDTSNDNNCTNWINAGLNTSVILNGLTLNTTYYWQVRSKNSYGTTYADGSTNWWRFTTGNVPGAFSKVTPSNSAINVSTNTTFSWGLSTGATSYEYCYDTTDDNVCSSWISVGTNTSANINGLNTSTIYFWQVRARNAFGIAYANGGSSAYWSFSTIIYLPGTFTKRLPTNGVIDFTSDPWLSWSTSLGATSYEYCIDTTNDNSCANWADVGNNSAIELNDMTPNTTYYWQVRANNNNGKTYADGSSTTYWNFTTGGLPGTFTKVAPLNGLTDLSTSFYLDWNASHGATGYEYCLSLDENDCSNWINSISSESYTPLTGLQPNTTYYWQVKAVDYFGNTDADGSIWSFATGDDSNSCYLLLLNHGGEGNDPIADPTNSIGCPIGQYKPGETIILSANPSPGFHVSSWSGTDDDTITIVTNTVTMPAELKTINVDYDKNNIYLPLVVR